MVKEYKHKQLLPGQGDNRIGGNKSEVKTPVLLQR